MSWLLPRIVATLAALFFGALLGALVGLLLGHALLTAVMGALGALAVAVLVDAARAHRLLEWLRGPQSQDAPRDTGFWGELGYRIERSLRRKDLALSQEHQRLDQFFAAIEASRRRPP